jgi:phenylpropionate dioxygenase-like ring-hydroxylating dioxygenase large terminal subunit
MDHATQVALARRIFGFLDTRTTEMAPAPYVNRVATYTSASQLERERAILFRREPLFVGLTCDVRDPGVYVVEEGTGVPVLVVRTAAGPLRAFVGLCRHRGAPVASGRGHVAARFTCPYHGWAYGDDGRLVSQPGREGFTGLSADALCLKPLPVAERHGLVFACAEPGGAIDVDAHLAGAEHELAPLGLERYQLFHRQEHRPAMNWKLVIDTFLEAYHVPALHARTLGSAIFGAPAAWDAFGRGGRLVAVRRSIEALRAQPDATWDLLQHSVVLYHLFPNTVLIHQIDHVEVVQVFPGERGADESRVVVSIYTPEAADTPRAVRHFDANRRLLEDTVVAEDFVLGERIQRGFQADDTATIVYGRNEPGVAHFERMVNRALAIDDVG